MRNVLTTVILKDDRSGFILINYDSGGADRIGCGSNRKGICRIRLKLILDLNSVDQPFWI
jgi:hypothetical protein